MHDKELGRDTEGEERGARPLKWKARTGEVQVVMECVPVWSTTHDAECTHSFIPALRISPVSVFTGLRRGDCGGNCGPCSPHDVMSGTRDGSTFSEWTAEERAHEEVEQRRVSRIMSHVIHDRCISSAIPDS